MYQVTFPEISIEIRPVQEELGLANEEDWNDDFIYDYKSKSHGTVQYCTTCCPHES